MSMNREAPCASVERSGSKSGGGAGCHLQLDTVADEVVGLVKDEGLAAWELQTCFAHTMLRFRTFDEEPKSVLKTSFRRFHMSHIATAKNTGQLT
ncbi:hypothetical protein V6N13_051993 [Hibiscus sabdariffa]